MNWLDWLIEHSEGGICRTVPIGELVEHRERLQALDQALEVEASEGGASGKSRTRNVSYAAQRLFKTRS